MTDRFRMIQRFFTSYYVFVISEIDMMVVANKVPRFWSAQTGELKTTYDTLREKHLALLAATTTTTTTSSGTERATSSAGASTAENSTDQDQEPPASDSNTVLDSLSKLEQEIGVQYKCNSEIGQVELIVGKDGSIWLLGGVDKSLPRHTVVGGYGTGQWVSEEESDPGVRFVITDDKAWIQLDESSFAAEAQGSSTVTLYKLLIRAEREKGLTEHRFSFLDISRKQDLEAGQDGFNIKVKTAMKFKCVRDPRTASGSEEKITAKNVFSKCLERNSDLLMDIYRFRYERVGQSFKVQRPYVCTTQHLTLSKDKPLKVTK